jgi:hypothetical protein
MKRVLKWVLIVVVAWVALIVEAGAWISSKVPVSLPMRSMFTDYWDRGWVQATGTWTIENGASKHPRFKLRRLTAGATTVSAASRARRLATAISVGLMLTPTRS